MQIKIIFVRCGDLNLCFNSGWGPIQAKFRVDSNLLRGPGLIQGGPGVQRVKSRQTSFAHAISSSEWLLSCTLQRSHPPMNRTIKMKNKEMIQSEHLGIVTYFLSPFTILSICIFVSYTTFDSCPNLQPYWMIPNITILFAFHFLSFVSCSAWTHHNKYLLNCSSCRLMWLQYMYWVLTPHTLQYRGSSNMRHSFVA